MPYMYMPMMRSKAGEITALDNLTQNAKLRIYPVIHMVSKPPLKFIDKFSQAWTSPMALDGLYNFTITNDINNFIAMLDGLRSKGVPASPSIECHADTIYVKACKKFITRKSPNFVIKATLAQLADLPAWMASNNLNEANADLVIDIGHVAEFVIKQFASFVSHTIQQDLTNPTAWKSITLASAAAPKDASGLQLGKNLVPRKDWLLWQGVHSKLNFDLHYADYCTSHPDLTEPPGVAMAKATVSVRYTVDDEWIIFKGRPTTGMNGQPMAQQYHRHAQALVKEPQFNKLHGCWADNKIAQIASSTGSKTGSRGTWVEIAANRHIELVADRLP